jgi:hypothetical protein
MLAIFALAFALQSPPAVPPQYRESPSHIRMMGRHVDNIPPLKIHHKHCKRHLGFPCTELKSQQPKG